MGMMLAAVSDKALVDKSVPSQGKERRDQRKIRQLHYVQPGTPLTVALGLLLEAGVSVLPVIDEVSAKTLCRNGSKREPCVWALTLPFCFLCSALLP